MKNKPVIVCMLWGAWGGTNPIQYVEKLRNMVARHTTIDYDFYCITDRHLGLEGVNEITLPNYITKWRFNLPKFYMHAEHEQLKGRRVLFFDLDMVLVGNIDDFLLYDGYLCTILPFQKKNHAISTPGGILSFVGGETAWIWETINFNPVYWERVTGGKERLILNQLEPHEKWDRWQNLLPGQLISYKRHVLNNADSHDVRVIAFHGEPRPHIAAKQSTYINKNWK